MYILYECSSSIFLINDWNTNDCRKWLYIGGECFFNNVNIIKIMEKKLLTIMNALDTPQHLIYQHQVQHLCHLEYNQKYNNQE